MDKSIAGLLGGVSALALAGSAHAASAPVEPVNTLPPAQSYAELLDPIPNAVELLKAQQTAESDAGIDQRQVELAQYYPYYPYYHHHHHHHHHHHYGWGWNPHQWWAWQHRHHHHHHHHYYPY